MPRVERRRSQIGRRTFVQRVTLAAGGMTATASAACRAVESSQAQPALGSVPQPAPAATPSATPAAFKLYHEVHGDGPAVVLAHGGGGTHMIWWQQVPVFSKSFKVVTFDHRGFGFSVDTPGGPGRGAFVEDLRTLLDSLGIQKAALVGQSMGGRTVLGFAAAYPERVTHLVMSSTTGGYTDPDLEAVRAKAPNLGPRRAYAQAFADRAPQLAFLYGNISRTNSYLTPPAAAEAAAAVSTRVPDITRVVAAGVPTLFLIGEKDTVAVPRVLEAMHRKMPGSQMVKLPESGHSPYFEMPDTFNRIVGDFIRTGKVRTQS